VSEVTADGLSWVSPCQSCGACCDYSREWPRLTLEDDDEIALIPSHLLDKDAGRMRCAGNRCSALVGEVGVSTACSIYDVRPLVCGACMPGDDACLAARKRHGLGALEIGQTYI
jgi:Fe-S-cluster containining protein